MKCTINHETVGLDLRKIRDEGEAIEMTIQEIREVLNVMPDNELADTIDKVQGDVNSKTINEGYIIIKIIP